MNYKKQLMEMRQRPSPVAGVDFIPPKKGQEISFHQLSDKRKKEAIEFMRENYKTNPFFEGEMLNTEDDESIIEHIAPYYVFKY